MLTKYLKKLSDTLASGLTCKASGSNCKKKAGFTIVELMVVIIIVNLLSGIAVPKLTDLIERTKERTDLLKFYYLRDALNRALYEDDVTRVDEKAKCGSQQNNATTLNNWLKSEKGVSLFIIELHDIFPANYQGENKKRTSHSAIRW